MTDTDIVIMPRPNGPYVVRGPARIVDPDGREFQVQRESIALCRCGASGQKPFCDGAHSKIGFSADTRVA